MTPEQFASEKAIIEPDARRAWDRDAKLRAEYGGDFDSYLSLCIARDKGLVRVRGGQSAGGR
jgi:hypothetical protein